MPHRPPRAHATRGNLRPSRRAGASHPLPRPPAQVKAHLQLLHEGEHRLPAQLHADPAPDRHCRGRRQALTSRTKDDPPHPTRPKMARLIMPVLHARAPSSVLKVNIVWFVLLVCSTKCNVL